MPPSIDMFWLFSAIRYGIPSALLLLTTFFAVCIPLTKLKFDDPFLNACRKGFLISMVGFFLVGWTVHFWNATYVIFMFLLGSSSWLRVSPAATVEGSERARGQAGRTSAASPALSASSNPGVAEALG